MCPFSSHRGEIITKKRGKNKLKPYSKIHPDDSISVPMPPEFAEELRYQMEKSHILESRLFPEFECMSEYDMVSKTVGLMKEAGIREELIYAHAKTQLLVTAENQKYIDEDDLIMWDYYIDEYHELTKKNKKNLIVKALKDLSKEPPLPPDYLTPEFLECLYNTRNLHTLLEKSCKKTFIDGHFRECIINGVLAVLNEIKRETGRVDIDGSDLINNVFSPNNPILETSSFRLGDKTEQEGVHYLFNGFVSAIRNQFMHRDIYIGNPFLAIEYLSFLNFLLIILDNVSLNREYLNNFENSE